MWTKKRASVILLLAAVVVVAGVYSAKHFANPPPPSSISPDARILVKGNNEFALDLYARLRHLQGNLFFSSFSISAAVAMTHAGARGQTEEQIAGALHFTLDQQRLHPAFLSLSSDLVATGKNPGYQLIVANSLWGQKGYGFLKGFLDITRTNYGAGLREVDFIEDAEAGRKTINDWVEGQTQGKITELIQPGILGSLTRLVLTSAIYFKGTWASQFDKEQTMNAPFALIDGKQVEVPMMNQIGNFKYMEGQGFQAVELPYIGNDLSMVVFLPKARNGLPNFENSLTVQNLINWFARLRPKEELQVALPRFTVKSQFRLDKVLKAMGMTDAFALGLADFSGMNGKKTLFISAVLHKAFVDVNEQGTEAVAATAIESRPGISATFWADHPFFFVIRHTGSNSILFIGRVMNPAE